MFDGNAQNTLPRNLPRNPHYENIYESIADMNAPAPVPAENNLPNAQLPNAGNNNTARINLRARASTSSAAAAAAAASSSSSASACLHPRNTYASAYDVPVPRQQQRNYYNLNTATRRATLEANHNRARYANTNRNAFRQRSFDDTESYHYSQNNNFRYENNIYEQIREEPIYRNISFGRDNAANRLYGRLDVIGHGIGRIERHLSSSCGNIDHYNLGGTYAILGHSHLSTVGHVYASNNPKEAAGKSLNFFSCLGRENSQSMSNICRETSNNNASNETAASGPSTAHPSAGPPQNNEQNINKHTGAIPKRKSKMQNQNQNQMRPSPTPNAMHSTALNRISKSSLQSLLINKWLPLWIGNGSDCNVLDFNFMFSRNCNGCEPRDDNVLVYNNASTGVAYANGYRNLGAENYYTISRPRCYHNSLMRFNESNSRRTYGPNRRPNYRRPETERTAYDMNDMPYDYRATPPPLENPFRRWQLNSENNSFRPASVRRITDGTFPNGAAAAAATNQNPNEAMHISNGHPNPNGNSQEVRVEINNQPVDAGASTSAAPSTSRATLPSATANAHGNAIATGNDEASTSVSSKLRPDRRAFENGALSSSTESTSETENKILSPDLSVARRYSENTEDDQYNCSNSSSTDDDDGNDDTISELHTNDTTDNSERINEQSN